MRNLRSTMFIMFALILAISPITIHASGSFSYESEAQVLNSLGLYNGISETTFDPDLGAALNRETGIVMLLKIFGLREEAEAMSDVDTNAALARFSDAASISSWAKKAVAYAVSNNLVQGYPDGSFAPKVSLNGKAYCTLILRQLGYTPNYNAAPMELADRGGLTLGQSTLFTDKNLIKDDLVGISYGSLSANDNDNRIVLSKLVEEGVVDEKKALETGLLDSEILSKAQAALAAYKAAPLTTLEEIAAAEALRIKAAEMIAKVADAAARAALENALEEQKARSDAAKAGLSQTTPSNGTNTNNNDDNDNDDDGDGDDDASDPAITITGLEISPMYINGTTDDNLLSFSVSPTGSVVEAVYGNNTPFGEALSQWEPGSYRLSFGGFDEASYTITITASKSGYTQANRTRNVIIDRTAPIISFANVEYGTSKLNIAIAGSGRYYYLVYSGSASVPDADTIKEQGAALSKGTGVFTDFQEVTMTGLEDSKAYQVHLIVEDAAGNLSDITSIAFEL